MDNRELEERIRQLDYVASNLESQVYSLKAEIKKLNDEKEKLLQGNNISQQNVKPQNNKTVYGKPDYNVQEANRSVIDQPVVSQPIASQQEYNQARFSNGQYGEVNNQQQDGYSYGSSINIVHSGKEKDFEHWFGKNMMSIIASVLIFISIIIFSTIFYPSLTDEIKVLAMFLFSFGLTGFGYLGVKKNNKDGFKIAVMACGLGCIFVSLLVTRIYFEMLDDGMVLIAAVIWAAAVCFLSKYSNTLFITIGQIGVFITIIVATQSLIDKIYEYRRAGLGKPDGNVIYAVIIAFILAEVMLYYSGKRNQNSVLVNHIGLLVGIFILFANFNTSELAKFSMLGGKEEYTLLLLIGVCIAALVYILVNNDKEIAGVNSIFAGLFSFAMGVFMLIFLENNLDGSEGCCLIVAAVIFALLMVYSYRYEKDTLTYRIAVTWLAVEVLFLIGAENEMWTMFVALLALLVFAYMGFVKNDRAYQWITVWSPFAYFLNMKSFPGTSLLIIIIISVAVPYLMYEFKSTYRQIYKTILYVEFLFFFAVLFEAVGKEFDIAREYLSLIKYIIVSVASVFAMKTDYAKSLIDGSDESDFKIVTYTINGIIMISGLSHIIRYNTNVYVHIMYIIVVLTLYSVNTVSLFDDYENGLIHAYVGFKYTVLFIVIFESFSAPNIVISIFCVLFASVCVVFGFMIYKKGLRIYGLWLSMIFVFKLILIDMSYDEPIAKALGFMAAGIICFAISALYNYAEGKIGLK